MERIAYFCAEEIAEKSWMIKNEITKSTPSICYLVEGRDYALLIDSIMGIGNLKAFCQTLTDKEIRVVNTHSHSDHIGGNFHFGHCFMHYRDITPFMMNLGYPKEEIFEMSKTLIPEEKQGQMVLDDNFADWEPIRVFPLVDGDAFDLGDRRIDVLWVGGHTAGSVVLIDHKTRICYCGDACNGNTLLELPDSLPIAVYLKNLLQFKAHQSEFDILYGGHEVMEPSIIDEAIETVARTVAGTDDRCERIGMMGAPIYYAAAKKENEYVRADGKRFNMSYLPSRVLGEDETRHVYTAKELLREENA